MPSQWEPAAFGRRRKTQHRCRANRVKYDADGNLTNIYAAPDVNRDGVGLWTFMSFPAGARLSFAPRLPGEAKFDFRTFWRP